ncbi:AAA family ATPase [Aquisalimonas asiatica]|uniref:Sporulation related domain-containing protein n=1 Tax=Aquisalimonas asiatica TaxID=406100 RepID=A0A1H8QRL1_9GAMM|nr:AAA family ATPase [Aquisalimonas asiatica]SEO56832.1 Sporulation related domain-containing protein [Aquisalimonas asiatica]
MSTNASSVQGSGLLQAPFHYADGERETRMNLLLQHLQVGERVVILEGDPGSGRTHLLHRILTRKDHGLQTHAVTVEPEVTFTEILLGMLEQFQHAEPTASAPNRIRDYAAERITGMLRAGESPVLAVDDADRLEPAMLDNLLAFREEARIASGRTLSLLLIGSHRLALQVAERDTEKRQSNPVAVSLHGLEPAATREFIRQALEADGDTAGHLLASLDIDAVHASSGGRPGAILQAARKQLAGGGEKPRPKKTASRSRPKTRRTLPAWLQLRGPKRSVAVVAAAASGLLVTLFALAWQLGDAPEPATVAQSLEVDPASAKGPSPGERLVVDVPVIDLDAEPPATAPETGEEPPVDLSGALPLFSHSEAAETDLTALAETRPQPDESADDAGESGETAAEDASPLQRALAEGQAWREDQSSDDWTVQLVGGRSPDNLRSWMESHNGAVDAYMLVTEWDGGDWYVVVTGADASESDARERLAELPDEVRQGGEWVRQLSDFQ